MARNLMNATKTVGIFFILKPDFPSSRNTRYAINVFTWRYDMSLPKWDDGKKRAHLDTAAALDVVGRLCEPARRVADPAYTGHIPPMNRNGVGYGD